MARLLLALGLSVLVTLPVPLAAQRIKLAASLGELETRVKQDSNDAAAHYNVALAYWAAKRYDDAERELHVATTIEPEFATPYLALAFLPYARRPSLWDEEAEHRLSDSLRTILEESDRMYRHAFLIDPLVDTRIVGATTPGKSVFVDLIDEFHDFYDYYFQAFDDLDQGNYDQARGRFQRILNDMDRHPDRIPNFILFWHGIAAAHVSRFDEAIRDFSGLMGRSAAREKRDSLVRMPLRTNEYRYILADMNRRAGKFEDAVPLYREALQNDIGLYTAHVRLAEIAEANNNVDAALVERRAAVDANPEDSGLMLDLAVTLAKKGAFAESEHVLQDMMNANPRDSRAAYYLGVVEQQLGKGDAARVAFTTFVSLAPSRYARQIQNAKQYLAQR